MGWYERLSGSDTREGARTASTVELIEIARWRNGDEGRPLGGGESLGWEGRLLTGYHVRKVAKDDTTEYITHPDLPGDTRKLNTY